MFLLYSVINGVQRHRAFVAMKTVRKTAKLNLRCYTGVPKKKKTCPWLPYLSEDVYTRLGVYGGAAGWSAGFTYGSEGFEAKLSKKKSCEHILFLVVLVEIFILANLGWEGVGNHQLLCFFKA
jgi:hypothetical protein